MNATTDTIERIKELAREHLRMMLMYTEQILRVPTQAKLDKLKRMTA